MEIRSVCLLGADGKLGPAILDALMSAKFNVTVLKRQSSSSPDNYPSGVNVARIPDDLNIDGLSLALHGHDAVVSAIKGSQTDVQKRLADAALSAGVKRFIPADFGSCDSSSALTQELVPLYKRKTELREYLQEIASKHPNFSWASIVCGHFFDWSLEFLHLWPAQKKAHILDDGSKKASYSTVAQVGRATAAILQCPGETANQMLYIQSFCVPQIDILRAYEKVTGCQWEVEHFDAEKYKADERVKAANGDLKALENLVWYLGYVDADWTTREKFAMKKLGLEDEDLQTTVDRVVASLKQAFQNG